MSTDDELAAAVRAALSAAANPERAVQQQAYLKSTMPCYGVGNPTVRMIVRNACAQRPELTRDEWIAAIRSLWTEATHREECLAAIELADAKRRWAGGDLMDLYESMAVTGAWWDLVDPLASHLVGDVLRAIDAYSTGAPITRLALQIAPHVMTRPGELRQALWDEFDLDAISPAKRNNAR